MEEKIQQLIKERNPWLLKDSFLSKTIYTLLKKYLRYDETVFVGDHIQSMTGEEAFNWLGSEYTSNSSVEGLENIPKDGKFLIVSNHPMGAADAIALYYQIYPVRNDLFFFANELFVGRLSKLTFFGLWDRPWEKTPIALAKKYNFPLIPVYVEGRNSWFFYFASYVNKQLRDISQLNELFNKRGKKMSIKIGKPVTVSTLNDNTDIAIGQMRYKSESLRKKAVLKLNRFLHLRNFR
ncbi:MAG: hypothetical protein EBX21_04440 [Proteobacteria bacterium]|nr:hypothetical protein [Pseudomonadota bacterium]